MILTLTADRAGNLSSFLTGELRLSTSLMNKLKWGDSLRVNGVPCRTNHPVFPGDVITVTMEEAEPEYPAQQGELTIVYEDAYLLAVDKPAGMLIHPSRSQNQGTLANFVTGYYLRTGQHCAFHPLTRLDRDTFGVVLLGKNAYVHTLLQSCPVEKIYHAITFGGPREDSGIIDVPIARREKPSLLRYADPAGKPSRTEFQVLERRGEICKLALRPVTGRTHQLRVHCAWAGFPILGDPQYGSVESQAWSRERDIPHQLLCAQTLTLPHPITAHSLTLRSTLSCQWP